ncbi:MAG: DNA-binding CsgD family transcriptional regulator [Saprospiraceae bacterium]|jgi:DNA-binding CsgD family transcriptional regulator|tara:strand:- start:1839 stop:3611 length:1773 start_codon:yes stop_codon:yes gene_type:complete
MLYRLLVLLVFLISFDCSSQSTRIDSLVEILEGDIDNEKKALLFSDLSRLYKDINLDSAIHYSTKGFNISNEIHHHVGIAQNATNLGLFNIMKNDLSQAKIFYTQAAENYLKINMLFESTQNKMRIGNINLAQNNYIEAIKIYQECLSVSEEKSFELLLPHLYNNLGLLYLEIEDFNGAQNNFDLANKLFLENNDEVSATLALYNISLIQSNIGEYDKAINGYLNVAAFHLKSENWLSLSFSYNSISEIYRIKKDYKKAEDFLTMALNALSGESDTFISGPTSLFEVGVYTNAAELYLETNNVTKGKEYATKGLDLAIKNSYKENIFRNAKVLGLLFDNEQVADSALFYYKLYLDNFDQHRNEIDVRKLTKLKMQNEFDEILKANEIDRIYKEASYKQRELKYLGLTGFAILGVIILILLYLNQKNKAAKLTLKQEKLELEKRELNLDLDYKKKELASNMMYLMEKNEFITSISRKLIELKPDAKMNNKELIQQIINEIKLNSTARIWDDFEIRFKEVHADFYTKLNSSYPDLTPNEIKICAFLRLNMTSKEISAITHQSVKSINMARFRLRKKINLEREENLISFLNGL